MNVFFNRLKSICEQMKIDGFVNETSFNSRELPTKTRDVKIDWKGEMDYFFYILEGKVMWPVPSV